MSASYSSIDVRVEGDDTDKITTGELVRLRICNDTTESSPFGVAVTVTADICRGLDDVEDDTSRKTVVVTMRTATSTANFRPIPELYYE